MGISCCNLQLPVIVILGGFNFLVAMVNWDIHPRKKHVETPVSEPQPGLPLARLSVSDPLGIESKTTGGRLEEIGRREPSESSVAKERFLTSKSYG